MSACIICAVQRNYGLTLPPAPTVGVTLNVQLWRSDGNSGTVRVNGGIPCTPGLVFPSDLTKIVLKIGGVEQAIGVAALRSEFNPDGSLRAFGLHSDQNVGASSVIDGTLEIGGAVRNTANDITWAEPVFGDGSTTATTAAMSHRAKIAVIDSQYLCDTWVALRGLSPESTWAADNAATLLQTDSATSYTAGWAYNWLRTNYGDKAFGNGGARYPYGLGAACGYIVANTAAKKRAFYDLFESLLVASCGGDASASSRVRIGSAIQAYNIVYGPAIDPTTPAATDVNDYALFGEENCSIFLDWPTGYLLTGWKQAWYWLAHKNSAEFGGGMSYTAFRDKMQEALPRFNAVRRRLPGYLGYIMHATLEVPYGGTSGRDNDVASYEVQLPWTIDAYEEQKYTTANWGSYFDGVVGMDPAGNPDLIGTGLHPLFQQSMAVVPTQVLYYENIYPDARILTAIVATAEALLTQEYYDSATDYWGSVYLQKTPPIVVGDLGPDDWFLTAMNGYTQSCAFAITGDEKYRTAALRCYRRAQLLDPPGVNGDFTMTGKAVGEYWGPYAFQAKFWLDGGQLRPCPGAHPTTIVNPITYTS